MKGKERKATYYLEITIVPIEEDGVHVFVTGRINRKKACFLIDTGASRSVMDKMRISRFFPGEGMTLEKMEQLSTGLGTNTMESNLVSLPIISFGRIRLRDYKMAVLDLSHINQSYNMLGIKEIDGVIGGDLLQQFNAVIDYGERQLIISRD